MPGFNKAKGRDLNTTVPNPSFENGYSSQADGCVRRACSCPFSSSHFFPFSHLLFFPFPTRNLYNVPSRWCAKIACNNCPTVTILAAAQAHLLEVFSPANTPLLFLSTNGPLSATCNIRSYTMPMAAGARASDDGADGKKAVWNAGTVRPILN